MKRSFLPIAVGAAFVTGSLLLVGRVHAQEPAGTAPVVAAASSGTGADVKAADLLRRAATLLAARPDLTANVEVITEFGTRYLDTRETGTIVLARPGLVRIDIERQRRVSPDSPWEATGNGSVAASDGVTAWNVVRHPESAQFDSAPVSAAWLGAALAPYGPLHGFFGAAAPAGSGDALSAARYVGRRDWDGETFDVVVAEAGGDSRTLWIAADGLLRRVQVLRSPAAGAGKGVGGRATFLRRDVRLSKVGALPTGQPTAARFSYQPPPGAVQTARPARAAASGPLSIGAEAPDFTAEDVAGRAVHLSDYRGKVVVLKFWATWCWPCRQSLPETERLAKEQAAGGDVVVLAVALWDSRKAFRDWVDRYARERKAAPADLPIRFAFDPRPQGEDAATALYGVRATPTELVIGRDGRIAAVKAGYTGPSERTADAVRAALAGHPPSLAATPVTSR